MITRMEIIYKSKEPCDVKPDIFSTGSYRITKDGKVLNFDFVDMEADCRFEDGFLYIDSFQRYFDEDLVKGMTLEEADLILRTARKEDYTEMYYECYLDDVGGQEIELEAIEITYYDYSEDGDGLPIKVRGEVFSGLDVKE